MNILRVASEKVDNKTWADKLLWEPSVSSKSEYIWDPYPYPGVEAETWCIWTKKVSKSNEK